MITESPTGSLWLYPFGFTPTSLPLTLCPFIKDFSIPLTPICASEYGVTLKSTINLPGATSLKKKMTVSPPRSHRVAHTSLELLPTPYWMLAGLVLCGSYVSSHSSCVLVSAVLLLCPEDTVLHLSSTPLALAVFPLTLSYWSQSLGDGVWYKCPICSWALHGHLCPPCLLSVTFLSLTTPPPLCE